MLLTFFWALTFNIHNSTNIVFMTIYVFSKTIWAFSTMQKYLVIHKWKFLYIHAYKKYHNKPVINLVWPTDNSFIHLIFIEYLLRGIFIQEYSANSLACSRIQAKERIVRNEVKANRVWEKGRSWEDFTGHLGSHSQGFEQRRNNVIWVARAQEMFYKRHFKAYAQNEKNFPWISLMPYLQLIKALFVLFLNYLIHTLRGTFLLS